MLADARPPPPEEQDDPERGSQAAVDGHGGDAGQGQDDPGHRRRPERLAEHRPGQQRHHDRVRVEQEGRGAGGGALDPEEPQAVEGGRLQQGDEEYLPPAQGPEPASGGRGQERPAPGQGDQEGAAEHEAGPGQRDGRPVGDDLLDADEGDAPHRGDEDRGGDVTRVHPVVVPTGGGLTPTGADLSR